MLVVSGPQPFIYNLAIVHCGTRHRHCCTGTTISPVRTICNHATWNFRPERWSRAADQLCQRACPETFSSDSQRDQVAFNL